ncbi:MAG: hypothetical protein IJT32_07485 [Lachnospiraceae bacterium]|nr:hypothetical protein [Lachnospiraceae bacterium]
MGGVKALLTIAAEEDDFDYDKFFTMFAKNYTEVMTPEFAYYNLTQDPHPCAFLRTNVTLQQFDIFYETYGIKESDNMYLAPENRIAVW